MYNLSSIINYMIICNNNYVYDIPLDVNNSVGTYDVHFLDIFHKMPRYFLYFFFKSCLTFNLFY